MGRKMNAKNTIRVPEDLSMEDLAKRRAKRRAQENEAPSDHQSSADHAPPPPAAKRRKTSAAVAAAAVSSAPPPSDKWGPTKCLGDKTNCLDKTAIAVTEFGDDCHVPSAATKSGDDSFQLKLRKRSQKLDASIALDGEDHLNSLSDEVVLRVFKLLPRKILVKCSLVCRRFRRLVMDDVFWRAVDLGLRHVPPGTVGQLLDRGVVSLRLARANLAPPLLSLPETGFVFDGSRRKTKITTLDLSMASVSPTELEELISHTAPSLKRLSLEQCGLTRGCLKKLWGSRCSNAVNNCSVLHTLNLAMCTGLGDGLGLREMLRGSRALRDLNLSWTGLTQGAVDRLAGCMPPKLSKLNLSGCRDTLTDDHVGDLILACPNLVELVVSDAVLLTDVSVGHVCGGLKQLRSFSASRCYKILPVSYLAFADHPRLEILQVYGCLRSEALAELKERLGPKIIVNEFMFSAVARPTVGTKRTSLWGIQVREAVRP